MDAPAKAMLAGFFLEAIAEVGPEKFDEAFRHVLRTSRFRPDIAEIRDVLGLNRDEDALQGRRELKSLLAAMRAHGTKLRPILGKVITTVDKDGRNIVSPQDYPRERATPPPTLSDRAERTLLDMGAGMRSLGLEMLAEDPRAQREGAESEGMVLLRIKRVEEAWMTSWKAAR